MDTKRPLPRSRIECDRYRIIEVTCIGWINREDDLLREILAVIGNTLAIGFEFLGGLSGRVGHGLGKSGCQTE